MHPFTDFTRNDNLLNPWVEEWKREGKKVFGYICSYVPEEILTAFDILPLRLRARYNSSTPAADALMSPTTCSFARCALEGALNRDYEFLDGMIGCNSCDQSRRLYDNVRLKAPLPYHYFLSVPATYNAITVEWLDHEFRNFIRDLENHLGITFSMDRLRKAIDTHNRTRGLLDRLYTEKRGGDRYFPGSEVMKIVLASVSMPRGAFNDLLGPLLDETETGFERKHHKARIMLVGSHLDDPDFIRMIENLGGAVVSDFLCFGARYFTDPVPDGEDLTGALAERYLSKIPCPRMSGGHPQRSNFVLERIRQHDVDGVIIQRMKFCPTWWGESFMLLEDLKKAGIPCLELEKEYMPSGSGAIKTRVQAFIETMERS